MRPTFDEMTLSRRPQRTLQSQLMKYGTLLIRSGFSCLLLIVTTLIAGAEEAENVDIIFDRKVVESVIKVDSSPYDIVPLGDNKTIFVTHFSTGAVSRIAENKVLAKAQVGSGPTGMALSKDGKRLYVGLAIENALAVLETDTLKTEKKIPIGAYPIGVRLSPDGRFVAVACYTSNTLELVSVTTGIRKSIQVGASPYLLAFSKDGKRIYVPAHAGATLAVVDLKPVEDNDLPDLALRKKIPTGRGPVGLALSGDEKFVYVANYSGDTVTVVSTESLQVTDTLKVGSKPYFIAVHPISGMVTVSNFGSPYLDAFHPNGQHTRIKVAESVINVYISPDGNRMFTTHWKGSSVSVIE